MRADGLGVLRVVRADFLDFRYFLGPIFVDSILGIAVLHVIVMITG